MKKIFICLLCFSCTLFAKESFSLKNRVHAGKSGDYIVTRQGSHYSLLLFHSLENHRVILEEIDIPVDGAKNLNWKQWAENNAPGHSSWIIYEIDLENNRLLECYSLSREGWLHIDRAHHFLTTLLSLQLKHSKERKKIGPPPLSDEPDRRPIWNPKKVVHGKKVEKAQFATYNARWPKDGSELADTNIEIYFDKGDTSFPFPYWIDINSPHYSYKIQGVDSGSGLDRILHELPRRPFSFSSNGEWMEHSLQLKLHCPNYYEQLDFFAIDTSEQTRIAIPIPIAKKEWLGDEELLLEISLDDIEKTLVKGHHYVWACMSEKPLGVYREIPDSFHWPLGEKESYEQ